MKCHSQNLDLPAVLVKASTGKPATGIHGATVHSAFNLPIFKPGKQVCYRKPSDEEPHKKRHLHNYLHTLIQC